MTAAAAAAIEPMLVASIFPITARATARASDLDGEEKEKPKKEGTRKTKPVALPRPDELWHTPTREAWATIGGWHYPVASEKFRTWLAGQLYECNRKAASKSALDELVTAYCAEAEYKGREHEVSLRTACKDGSVWLDLTDKEGHAICINKEGWKVVGPPWVRVKFYRPQNMHALPVPQPDDADTKLLKGLLNIQDEDTLRLVLTWLSFAILPDQPYPVLAVSGPAGSAKSSFAQTIRSIIDPSEVPLVGMPHGQDLVAYAKNNAILCFDNLSTIRPYLADDLCRLATGGGLGGRKLYTDNTEATFRASRPIILTGINEVATRGDLADRSLAIHLEAISEADRRTAAEMKKAFEDAHPRILAGLLDMAVAGLQRQETVRNQRRNHPRMADFAQWGFAVAPALGWSEDDFDRAYRHNRHGANEAVIEDDLVAQGILQLMEQRPENIWRGTTKQLWIALRRQLGEATYTLDFPRSPVALGKRLPRIEPALADRGIHVKTARVSVGTEVTISKWHGNEGAGGGAD
jgi:putative DNA primase/helicase